MSLDDKKKEEARKRFESGFVGVDELDMDYAWQKGKRQLDGMEAPAGSMTEVWQETKLMVRALEDYRQGRYNGFSDRAIAAMTSAIIYFVAPVDVIPDFIPGIGYDDDAYVVKLSLEICSEELEEYSKSCSAN